MDASTEAALSPVRGNAMRAIVQQKYGAPGDVLRLTEVAMPAVGAQDVLVSVRASSANPWDWHFIRGEPVLLRTAGLGGVRTPKFPVPGGDLAGTVERAGSGVTAFKPGDEVYGFAHGAFAEYIAVPEGSLAPKPGNLTFEQAAAVPLAAVTALQCLRAGGIRPGQHVVIVGASGGVGTFAVQIAKHLGAQVTGVCSTRHQVQVPGRSSTTPPRTSPPAPPATTWPFSSAAATRPRRSDGCSHRAGHSSSPSAMVAAGSARWATSSRPRLSTHWPGRP